jgi:preprotein translocase subunit SecY
MWELKLALPTQSRCQWDRTCSKLHILARKTVRVYKFKTRSSASWHSRLCKPTLASASTGNSEERFKGGLRDNLFPGGEDQDPKGVVNVLSNNYDDDHYDILDAPGLNPRPDQLPRSDPLHRFGRAIHRVVALVFPSLASIELLRRIMVTLFMLFLVRVGHYIPLPGLDLNQVFATVDTTATVHTAGATSLTSLITGSYEIPGNIYMLSITPFMTASLALAALQLLPGLRKHLKQLRDEGRPGREVINGYLNVLFINASVGQAIVESGRLLDLTVLEMIQKKWLFRCETALTLLAGAAICKWAVQAIDQRGLGDGIGIVIGAGIAVSYVQSTFLQLAQTIMSTAPPSTTAMAMVLFIVFSLITLVVWVQGMEIRFPLILYSSRKSMIRASHPLLQRLSQGNITSATALAEQNFLPMRLSPAGTRQLLFANFWVGLLQAPLAAIGLPNLLANPFAFAALVFVLEAVSFADSTPRQLADFLAQNDTGIVGISPGADTERFLTLRSRQLKFINAFFIATVSLLARAVDVASALLIGAPIGCLSLLLLVR